MQRFSAFVLFFVVLAFGCGESVPTPAPSTPFGPPSGLKAFSVNQSSVSIRWSGTTDTTVQGYIAQVGAHTDTLPSTTLTYASHGLPSGESTFLVYSLGRDGLRSDAATIRWAPAARFDSAYSLYESNTVVSVRPEGFHVGSTTTNPLPMVIDPLNPTVQQLMDFYVYGGTQQIQQPLAMRSANTYIGTYNHTLFSTQTDPSPTLDFPLAAFPAEDTFVKDTITIADNVIYYAKVVGDPLQFNYVRIHIRYRFGSVFPDRIIDVRVSLQRVAGLRYALVPQEHSGDLLRDLMFLSYYNFFHS
ncbi:MAG TPA: hypothetical protein DGH68_02660 [Bacteroidetes bacterium]|nr:hypothetical protein [Bacteroidota bacterium]